MGNGAAGAIVVFDVSDSSNLLHLSTIDEWRIVLEQYVTYIIADRRDP